MKISIITAVYNNKKTIKDAIESVINQTHNNIEYIIIDGGSDDGTVDIVKSYGEKIDKFISEKDGGIYDALNKGLKIATGDAIGFMHSDDIYVDNTIIKKISKEFKNYNLDGIYGNLVYINKNNTSKTVRYWKSEKFDKRLLKKGWMPPHPTLFLKKKIYDKYGNFDTTFRIAADYDFILRIFQKNLNIKYLPTVFYKMRMGGASNQSIKNIILKSKEDLKALKKNNIGGLSTLFFKNFSKIQQFLSIRN